ncbi:MAG: hypothetical protein N2645_13245 [Clostridia bacterium]|nr:hypothetical protein [Clostridia bacterium]
MKKKYLKLLILIILISSLGLNIYSFMRHKYLNEKYKALVCFSNQFDETSLVSFIYSMDFSGYENSTVEIFDITRGTVIKEVLPSPAIQKEAEKYLHAITGIYARFRALPDTGYIVKIPFSPPLTTESPWPQNDHIHSVNELYILFPPKEVPYLMVLDDKYRPFCYYFEGSTEVLLRYLGLPPSSAEDF